MLFAIAIKLGKMVSEIENEMTASEFYEWVAYFEMMRGNDG